MVRKLLNEDKCCFCCGDLRIGSHAIAIIHLCKSIGFILYLLISRNQEEENTIEMLESAIFYPILTAAAIFFAGDLILVIGHIKRNQYLFIPWLTTELLECLTIVCCTGYYFLIVVYLAELVWLEAVLVVTIVFTLGVFIYMWCVVYSYYAVLQEENSRGLYDKQPYRR